MKEESERGSYRKESDLEGHIEAADLKENTSLDGFAGDIQKWATNLKGDPQLRVAYTYIRSWSRFSKN